jgi:hypothetical protein
VRRRSKAPWPERSAPARAPSSRVEQHRVLAHQATGRPRDLEDHVDEGLLHRAIAGDAQIRTAVAAALQFDLRDWQHIVVVDTRGAVGLGRRHTHAQAGGLLGRETGDVDLGPQRLAQCRLHGKPAQTQRVRIRCGEPEGGCSHTGQGKTP